MDPWTLQGYAALAIKLGKEDLARKVYGKEVAEKFLENKEANELNNFAWFWALEGKNLEYALEMSKKSLELDDNHYFWDTLSLIYWKLGKLQEALEAEKKALQLAGGKNEMYEKQIEGIKKDMES